VSIICALSWWCRTALSRNLKRLQGQTVALGQPGSATGYYFPIYNLYGLELSEIMLVTTPKTVLERLLKAMLLLGSLEFNTYSPQLSQTEFRVLFTDPHYPPGVVLIAPTMKRVAQSKSTKL